MAGFYIEIKGLAEAQKTLADIRDGTKKAIVRALNRTVTAVQSDAVKAVAAEFNLTQKDIRHDFTIKKANYGDFSAYVQAAGKPTPLIKFIRTRQTQKGVSVQVKKSRSRAVIKHAFIVTQRSGYRGVFLRVGRARYPIKQRYGPRVPDILSNPEVMGPILEQARERLDKNFEHEVDFLLESK